MELVVVVVVVDVRYERRVLDIGKDTRGTYVCVLGTCVCEGHGRRHRRGVLQFGHLMWNHKRTVAPTRSRNQSQSQSHSQSHPPALASNDKLCTSPPPPPPSLSLASYQCHMYHMGGVAA